MAQSTIQIDFTVNGNTQAQADQIRDNGIIDYCKAYGLDIYEQDGVTINPAKTVAAFRSQLRQHVVEVVKIQRSSSSAEAVRLSTQAATEAELAE